MKSNIDNSTKEYFNQYNFNEFTSQKTIFNNLDTNIYELNFGFPLSTFLSKEILDEIYQNIKKNKDSKMIGYTCLSNYGMGFEFFESYLPSWSQINQNDLELFITTSKNATVLAQSLRLINGNIFKPVSDNNYRINMYFSGIEKKFSGKIIDIKHINSGETGTEKNIPIHNYQISNIYRREEVNKVTLHELIHAMGITTISIPNKYFNLQTAGNILIVSESITELMALITNCMLLSNNYEEFINFFLYEFKFNLFQIAKILILSELNTFTEILMKNGNKNKIIQKTAAFEYFIIKTILILYLDTILKIINTSKNLDDIKNVIISILDDFYKNDNNIKLISESVDEIIQYIKLNKESLDKYALETARMTCVEPALKKNLNGGSINKTITYKRINKYIVYKIKN